MQIAFLLYTIPVVNMAQIHARKHIKCTSNFLDSTNKTDISWAHISNFVTHTDYTLVVPFMYSFLPNYNINLYKIMISWYGKDHKK